MQSLVDNRAFLDASFELLYRDIKDIRKDFNKGQELFNLLCKVDLVYICDSSFRAYSNMIDTIRRKLFNQIPRIVVELFQRNEITNDQKIDERFFCDFKKNSDRIIGAFLEYSVPKTNWLEEKTKCLDEAGYSGLVYLVLLTNNIVETVDSITLENNTKGINSNTVHFELIYLYDFISKFLGEDIAKYFKSCIVSLSEKIRTILDYGFVPLQSDNHLESFKDEVLLFLRTFDYESLLSPKIKNTQKIILKNNYLDSGLYSALVGDNAFADSFLSSEWQFQKLNDIFSLDRTGIIAGYLKSIEQLLFAIAKLSINKGLYIQAINKNETIEFSTDSLDNIDKTLKSLTRFFKDTDNQELVDVHYYVKKYITDKIDDWRKDKRNGYFHQENLKDPTVIEEVRRDTVFLYYLILGGLKIDTSSYETLGVINFKAKQEEALNSQVFNREAFSRWITPILGVGIPEELDGAWFFVNQNHSRYEKDDNTHWYLHLSIKSGFNKNDVTWVFNNNTNLVSFADLEWIENCSRNEMYDIVTKVITEYFENLDNENPFKKLKGAVVQCGGIMKTIVIH